MSRQAGWYWVKEDALSPRWEAAEWCPEFNGWSVTANEEWVRDENLAAVGGRIPTPDEPWQCVPVELIDWVRGAQRLMRALPDDGGWPAAAIQADMLLAAPKPGGGS